MPGNTKARLQEARRLLEDDPKVVFAYLFGSFGRYNPTPLSDVDIAVYLDPDALAADACLDLTEALTRAMQTDDVDLVVLNDAPLSLAGRIQQSAKVLVDREPGLRFAYESLVRRQFADFARRERDILFRRYGIDRSGTDSAQAR